MNATSVVNQWSLCLGINHITHILSSSDTRFRFASLGYKLELTLGTYYHHSI